MSAHRGLNLACRRMRCALFAIQRRIRLGNVLALRCSLMSRRASLGSMALVVLLALAACGDDSDPRGDAAAGGACRDGRATLTSALESSLTAAGAKELRRVRTVKIHGGPVPPVTLLKKGAYIASGTMIKTGGERQTLSWVVSASMLTTGGGIGYALDRATRKASVLGSAAKPGSPARDYAIAISNSEAYKQSRACVRQESGSRSEAKSESNVSHANFVKKLNRLCRSGTKALDRVADESFASKDPRVVAGAFDASAKQYDAVLSKLKKLAVPAADRSAFDEYVTSIKRSRRVAARIADKLRADKPAAHLVKALTDEKQTRLLAGLNLGADDCG